MATIETPAKYGMTLRTGAEALRRWVGQNKQRSVALAAYAVAVLAMLVLVVSAMWGTDADRASARPAKADARAKPRAARDSRAMDADVRAAPQKLAPAEPETREPKTPASSGKTHRVSTGDTLFGIALQYGTTVDELIALNPGIDPQVLTHGQEIRVP